MKCDIVIATIPFMWRMPQLAPAILKSVIEANGYKCKVVDWNIQLSNDLHDQSYWENKGRKISQHQWEQLKRYTEKWVDDLKQINPTWFGVSLFSMDRNFVFARNIAKEIKSKLPHIKLVVGGNAVNSSTYDTLSNFFDHVIIGEGENQIVNLLGNTNYIDTFSNGDYSDLDMSLYSRKTFFLYLSRGCIFNCKYCNRMVPKFACRPGSKVAEEAKTLVETYSINSFYFADPIINGNVNELVSFCRNIIDYKLDISWGGFAGIRSKKIMTDEVFSLISQSGCSWLSFGVESASNDLRLKLGKRISNDDIKHSMECCQKYNINPTVNLIVGHYLETDQDFKETIDWLKEYKSPNITIIPNVYGVLFGSYEYNNREKTVDKHPSKDIRTNHRKV